MPKKKENNIESKPSTTTATNLVAKVWNFCHILRDDGVSYGDYLEQLTFLIFLKMVNELGKEIPAEYAWPVLLSKSGSDLGEYYPKLLLALSKQPGMMGQIFLQAQNRINSPAKLSQIIAMIDAQTWSGLDTDVKGEIYEGLLQKNAEDVKSGAGQYFTPRDLISTIVECVRPEPGKTICDPACGTGGFLLKAYDFLTEHYAATMDIDEKKFLKHKTFFGNEIVPSTRRLCLMNMYLHNIGEINGIPSISITDSLVADPGTRFDYILTNPPFGKKSAQTITNDDGEEEKEAVSYNRQDFWTSTSNKQLNFVQHIHTILKTNGRAAVVLPDNVLFEGGAGEVIRRKLMETSDLHTILRLPTGVFYAQGVRANVLFFDARPASKAPQTSEIWVYDYRTNVHHTLKAKPMHCEDLADFVKCYNPENRLARKETYDAEKNPSGRWRKFSYAEIIGRDKTNLDISWIKEEGESADDYTLAELFSKIEAKSKNISEAVQTLKKLIGEIEE